MLRSLTAKQFAGWRQYAAIEPFEFDTETRADYRAALIAQVIANVNRGEKQKAFTLKDFLLSFEEKEPPTPEQRRASHLLFIKSIAQAYAAGKDT